MTTNRQETGHAVTARVAVGAEAAFGFLSDPIALGGWSLGCMNTAPVPGAPGVYAGRSLFDGSETRFAIDADPARGVIDFLLGDAGAMVPRISIRIVPADVCGLGGAECLVTMSAWRASDMDDTRWQQLCACHEAEIHLIRAQCEAAVAGRPVRPFAATA
ncbi:hypothetical protein [Psychromarinibacter sp. S121]|uniref:hypothetical protein n=1 Tax=Psychromarinibacter sp. S121 TaxID=3415127 RepID=UPI003C7C14F6